MPRDRSDSGGLHLAGMMSQTYWRIQWLPETGSDGFTLGDALPDIFGHDATGGRAVGRHRWAFRFQ